MADAVGVNVAALATVVVGRVAGVVVAVTVAVAVGGTGVTVNVVVADCPVRMVKCDGMGELQASAPTMIMLVIDRTAMTCRWRWEISPINRLASSRKLVPAKQPDRQHRKGRRSG